MTKTRQARQVISLSEARYHRAYRRLLADLLAYARDLLDDEPWALDQFFGPDAAESEVEALHEAFLDWVIFNYRDWDGRTVLDRFADEPAQSVADETEQTLLHAWRKSRPGLYRISSQAAGVVTLADLFTEATVEVQMESDMAPFRANDLVLSRILPSGEDHRFGLDVRTGPAAAERLIRRAAETELARMRLQDPAAGWDELFTERWPLLNDAMTRAIASGDVAPPPAPAARASLGRTEPPPDAPALQCEVADLLDAFLQDEGVHWADRQRALRLWWDAVAVLAPRTGRADAWAAGVVYAALHYGMADGTTQSDIAEGLGVSVSSLASRSRAIVGALGLSELDERYADPYDPRCRFQPLAMRQVLQLVEQPAAGQEPDSVHDRVVLLAAQENDEGLLSAVRGIDPGDLDSFTLLRAGIAAARRGSLAQADRWMALAEERRELPHLTVPYRAALALMNEGRIPALAFDYTESIELPGPESAHLTSLMRALLVHTIYCRGEEQATEAVRVTGLMPPDPWLDELLVRIAMDPSVPESVRATARTSMGLRQEE